MCVVEVKRGKRTRLVTSCNFPCEEGLEVFTDTERVRQHRRIMAELLLARCPDIPKVQEIAASVGVEKSRFKTVGEPSDCVMCGLCVRICDQIVGASALSFIGLGVRPPTPEWGIMVAEGANFIVSGEWWLAVFPGLWLMLAVFTFNLLGDGLRDIVDPRKRT